MFWEHTLGTRDESSHNASCTAYLQLMAGVIVVGCWPHQEHRSRPISSAIGTPKKRINPKRARREAFITRARIIFSALIVCTKPHINLNTVRLGPKDQTGVESKYLKTTRYIYIFRNIISKNKGEYWRRSFHGKIRKNGIIVNENVAGSTRFLRRSHVQRKGDSPLSPGDKSESFRFANLVASPSPRFMLS